jgi:hypothetical protein
MARTIISIVCSPLTIFFFFFPSFSVYFLYPETRGVRLEDMGALFGDTTHPHGTPVASSSATDTPALRAESDALLRPASPATPLDGPAGGIGRMARTSGSEEGPAAGGWFSGIVGRKGKDRAGYAPVGQRREDN